jgi:hypothetical protein
MCISVFCHIIQKKSVLLRALCHITRKKSAVLKHDYSVSLFLEKRLASQYMFLVKSELSIITYLFLVFYKSTSS